MRDLVRHFNQNNLINSGNQNNIQESVNSSENRHIRMQSSTSEVFQNSQDNQTNHFLNRKIFEFIKIFMLLIFLIILVFETKYVMNINDKKKEEIKNLNAIINIYNSKRNINQSSIIPTELPKTTIYNNNCSNQTTSKTSTINITNNYNTTSIIITINTSKISTTNINKIIDTTNNNNTNIKISTTNLIKAIDTTNNNNTNIKISTTNIIKAIDTSKISSNNIINTLYTTNKINIINSTNIKNYFTTTPVGKSTTIKDNDNIDIVNNTIINNLNCSSGYFMSYDINGNKQCQKCYIENCKNCIDDGNCKLCESQFLPYYENGIITSCEYSCKDDPENKCLLCENHDKCKICDIGYKLIDGMCLINHSIKAIYYSQEENNIIQLINNTYEKYILEMIVDGNKISPTYNYTFQNKGNHTVYFLINNNFTSLNKMFNEIYGITIIIFTKMLNTENIKDMSEMFSNCNSLKYIDISNFNTKNVENIDSMFYKCENLISINLYNFNTQNVKYMGNLFSLCEKLEYIDISNFNTQNVKDMGSMFHECSSLTSIDVSKFNTKNVDDMSFMFSGCKSLSSISLANFDTKSVTNMKYMFSNCKNLKNINLLNFDTHKVNKLNAFFLNCYSLTSINISNFNTENVNDIKQMFENCASLKSLNLSNFDTISVTDMHNMFYNCKNLTILDISSFRNYKYNDKITFQQLFKGIPSFTNIIMNKNFSEHRFVKYQLKSLNITIIE